MRYSDNADNINYHGWFIRSVIVNDLFGRRIAKDRYAEHGDIYYGKQASQGGRKKRFNLVYSKFIRAWSPLMPPSKCGHYE